MDAVSGLQDISIESISALKQAETQNQFAVKVMKGINEQAKTVGSQLINLIEGKGQRVDVVA